MCSRVSPPTTETLHALSERLGLQLTHADLEELAPVVASHVASIDRTAELHDEARAKDVVPAREGHRPDESANPLRAWSWRCDIRGSATATGPLAGKTIALKDNVSVAGAPMVNGSKILDGCVPERDATIVRRALAAGLTVAGKAHCEDLCLSGGSFTNYYGTVRNPFDPTRQAGGSSSGSGALVATGDVDCAVACDQGGSIRIPSCWSGVVGLKPTWGRVPYTGIFAMAPTLDHAGPVARDVATAAALLDVLAGDDGLDPRSAGSPIPPRGGYAGAVADPLDLSRVKIGVLVEGFGLPNLAPEVKEAAMAAVQLLAGAGAAVSEVSVPVHADAPHLFMAIGLEGIEHTQFGCGGQGADLRGEYHPDVARAFAQGMKAHAADLSKTNKAFLLVGAHLRENYGGEHKAAGQNTARWAKAAYDAALQEYDVLVMPTLPMLPTLPPTERRGAEVGEYFTKALEMIGNTAPFNVTGHPALTVPLPLIDGLPAGLQVVGRWWDEATVLRVGRAYEGLRGPISYAAAEANACPK